MRQRPSFSRYIKSQIKEDLKNSKVIRLKLIRQIGESIFAKSN